MAIAFGAAVNDTDTSGSTTVSQTGPTVSGANTLGIVVVRWQDSSANPTVTWGGVSMTLIGSFQQESNTRNCAAYYIKNPASAATVTCTRSGSTNGFSMSSVYYTGIDQTTPIDANTTQSAGSGSSFSPALTVVNAGSWLMAYVRGAGGTASAGSGTTERSNQSATTGCCYGDSNATVATGSRSLNFTGTTGQWDAVIFSLKVAAAVATGSMMPFL